eukprot:TRINITY_DN260_c2_g1_i1.p1 TRINITY_DN260_c2_g1~~TRINITY_DN260_c2_g1_i1.p1  ORF type:complete len:664 (+),score=178.54 TRINITY_DN260_c2_g1_i1:1178-3169(+)
MQGWFKASHSVRNQLRLVTPTKFSPLLLKSWCTMESSGLVSSAAHSGAAARTLETLSFDNTALQHLPIDQVADNYVRGNVSGAVFSRVTPTPVSNPRLVCWSPPAMSLIDLAEDQAKQPEFVEYFSGNKLLAGSAPAAHCYCGHQFGSFAGQLGDGRAMSLGEVVNARGERWELQLKGSGPTPYSRGSDGRAVLRSSIREFLASEAMAYLGVPTTRAGTLITSDTKVIRDVFYNGNPIEERATLVLRLAPTFLRFGSFEIFKPQDRLTGRVGPSVGRKELLRQMLDYTIEHHFAQLCSAPTAEERYLQLFKEVSTRTARLIADWQAVGFCHGVLNTDNMSILGVTIDYGPYGFLDAFNAQHICNASDHEGRYAYAKQPQIGFWNLVKLAEAFGCGALPLPQLRALLDEVYWPTFDAAYLENMQRKLGLTAAAAAEAGSDDRALVDELLRTMQATGADFTCTFRSLSRLAIGRADPADSTLEAAFDVLRPLLLPPQRMPVHTRIPLSQLAALLSLSAANPALLAMLGTDTGTLLRERESHATGQQLRAKTADQKAAEDRNLWLAWLALYAKRLTAEVPRDVTDADLERANNERRERMDAVNAKFILRNHLAQAAIDKAEAGDFSEVQRLFQALQTPFSDDVADALCVPPNAEAAAATCSVSCSS